MMSTDQQTNEMSAENANNEMSEEMYETEIQTLLGDNANYTAGQIDNANIEGANNGIIYVEVTIFVKAIMIYVKKLRRINVEIYF